MTSPPPAEQSLLTTRAPECPHCNAGKAEQIESQRQTLERRQRRTDNARAELAVRLDDEPDLAPDQREDMRLDLADLDEQLQEIAEQIKDLDDDAADRGGPYSSVEKVLVHYPITLSTGDDGLAVVEYTGGSADNFWDTAEPVQQDGGRLIHCGQCDQDFILLESEQVSDDVAVLG